MISEAPDPTLSPAAEARVREQRRRELLNFLERIRLDAGRGSRLADSLDNPFQADTIKLIGDLAAHLAVGVRERGKLDNAAGR